MTSIRLPPTPSQFYADYLVITEGRCPENQTARQVAFRKYTAELTSSDEFKIVQFMNRSIKQLAQLQKYEHANGPKPRGTLYFKNFEHLFNFFAGIVHYCPTILLHQLNEQSQVQRFHVVELIYGVTVYLCLPNYSYSYEKVFFTKTKDSSPYHFLVFEEYLKRATDSSPKIRESFLNCAFNMLTCEVEPDWSVRQMAASKMAQRMHLDPRANTRLKALSSLDLLFTETENAISAFNVELLSTLAHLCFDKNATIRRQAQVCATKGYIRLMQQYPVEVIPVKTVGQLAGALKRKYTESVGDERTRLGMLLSIVKQFLIDRKGKLNYPAEYYFRSPIFLESGER